MKKHGVERLNAQNRDLPPPPSAGTVYSIKYNIIIYSTVLGKLKFEKRARFALE